MSIIRWNPLRDVTAWHPTDDLVSDFFSMQRDIDRMFDRLRGVSSEGSAASTWLPVVDIVEGGNDYTVNVELFLP